MSLKGVVEFALKIDSFRNIDLFHQGLYQVRFSIYYLKNEQKVFAHPYHTRETKSRDPKKKESKPIIPAHIVDDNSSYATRTFLIRFCDEETEFNEVCHFRMEYDAFPDLAETTFYIEAELMYADLGKLSQPQSKDTLQTSFKAISVYKAKVNNIQAGVYEYMPILFDDNHFCVLETTFHAVLMDLRFRTSPIEAIREDTLVNDLAGDMKPVITIPPPKNFNEFLARNTAEFKPNELDKFYNYYIRSLKRSYEKLVEFYAFSLKLCWMQKNRNDYEKYLDGAPFKDTITEYVTNDTEFRGDNSGKNNKKEESKVPEKPKKIFDNTMADKKISELLDPNDPAAISVIIMQEVNMLAGNIFQMWYLLIEMLLEGPRAISAILKDDYYKQLKERWGESIFQQIYKIPDLALTYEQKLGENHKQIASARRNNLYYKVLDIYNSIEDLNMFPKPEFHPILFEEVYIKEIAGQEKNTDAIINNIETNYTRVSYKGAHLIVFCHGFQGNSFDLRLFKNNISYLYPDTLFLCASSNEDMTDGEIDLMGTRLASEVKSYIEEWIPGNNLNRLSFIGHSMGGLVIRAALPHLEQFADKMHMYMTLSSPHLGYMYHSSKIIDAGMWVLKKWKKSRALTELTMTDTTKMEDSYLFRLSSAKGLGWFKIITLLSSYQDQYAPFESARIQIGKKAIQDTSRGAVYAQMVQNILSHITTNCIYRIDINFKIEEKNLDSMIGRSAHIRFLESQALMRMLVHRYANFFS